MDRAKAGVIRGAALLAALAALCVLAPSAGAVLVRVSKHHVAGVTLAKGVRPTSVTGSLAQGAAAPADDGTVDYHGGPVLHGSTPYLIFWDPKSELTSSDKALFERYFADVAGDSGESTNTFGVDRQYTDSTGFADYTQSWSASHALVDKQPYPTSGQCMDNAGYTENACLFDSQLQAELSRLIDADGLPTGTTGDAPIYFIVTPPDVNSCIPALGVNADECADTTFCAYHSYYSVGGNNVLYADIPTVLAKNDPKQCQQDANTRVQSPNSNSLVDVALKDASHEANETITDPLLSAWWDSSSGNEIADNCNATGNVDPPDQTNPKAFTPTLGGSASAGTLYNQQINSHHYYTQSVWSNGDQDCVMRPTSSALSAAFSAPASGTTGHSVGFTPSASSSARGYSSTTWDFGDGTSAFSLGAPTATSHTYTTPGTYQVALTLVDRYGNLSTTSKQVTILPAPRAAFTSSSGNPQINTVVSFDGSGSSEPGNPPLSYSWNFGDGSSGSGPTVLHSYASPGVYTVSLTVSDGTHDDTVSQPLIVHGLPSAAVGVPTMIRVAGSPVSFDGSGSSEPFGSISSYSWNFGDGSPAAGGAKPSHAYARAGTYTVRLTVTDPFGNSAVSSRAVSVASVPGAAITVGSARPVSGAALSFSGVGSTDLGASISSYSWSFGDGSRGSGASASHRYSKPGRYKVTLTIADSTGATSTATKTLSVRNPSITAVSVKKGNKIERIKLMFSGSGTLKLGHKKFKIRKAGKFVLKVRLTAAQVAARHAHRSVTIRVKLRFSPVFGNPSRRSVTIRLRG